MDKTQLLDKMPDYYRKSKVIDFYLTKNANEITIIENKYNNIKNQLYVSTADTDLYRYEKEFGIVTDTNKSISERRAIVQAKRLGQGICTKKLIKDTCLKFVQNVDVLEFAKKGYFQVDIIINGELPYTLDSLYKSINNIKPSHINVKYNLVNITNGKLYFGGTNVIIEKSTIYPQEVIK